MGASQWVGLLDTAEVQIPTIPPAILWVRGTVNNIDKRIAPSLDDAILESCQRSCGILVLNCILCDQFCIIRIVILKSF